MALKYGALDQTHIANALGGQMGATLFTDTTARTPGTGNFWIALIVLTDAVFTLLTNDVGLDGNAITGVTFPKGSLIYGRFTAITLASGSLWALRGN